MVNEKFVYICSQCGYESTKWIGKCPNCKSWNSFEEKRKINQSKSKKNEGRTLGLYVQTKQNEPTPLYKVTTEFESRIDLKDKEFNRVLGGGLVPGSIVLLGGEPGIGKSTLVLQTILNLTDIRILYVSGEESAKQIKMRADRISLAAAKDLIIYCETSLQDIFEQIKNIKPQILIIDSIQTITSNEIESSAGSFVQVKECAAELLRFAKTSGTPVILIGHINKTGILAGPKVLEHIVDTVIQFEGDQHYFFRILRAIKNRFGSTSELGIYEMKSNGLRQISNPSEILLSHGQENLSGVAITCSIEGVRPFLIETQALVSSSAYGTPQRTSTGFDQKRLNMLLAVLEKRVGFKIMQKDIFINIAGGFQTTDLAIDLSVISAILSSHLDIPIEQGWCMAGEVGLSGEVRPVNRIEQRILEAEKLGFKNIIISSFSLKNLPKKFNINIHPISKVEESIKLLFG